MDERTFWEMQRRTQRQADAIISRMMRDRYNMVMESLRTTPGDTGVIDVYLDSPIEFDGEEH